MNATPRMIVCKPGSLLPYLANMDKIAAVVNQMRAQTDAINNAMQGHTRALQFLVKQYQQSALAKKRAAKLNLTAACNRALALTRRTLRELIATLFAHTDRETFEQSRDMFYELQQANAPNRCTQNKNASLRQQLQTKAGTHQRI